MGDVVGATLGGETEGMEEDDGTCCGEDDGREGNKSLRLRMVANLVKPLYVGSLASNDGQRVDGGCFKRVIMSVVACQRKSDNLTSGKGIECGKNVAVSTIRSERVLGK